MRSLRLIMEGSRDNMLLKYLEMVKQVHPDMTLSMLKKILLEKFVSYGHIMALSLGSNFYLAGAAKYYFNGDLTRNKEVNLLNPEIEDEFIEDVCKSLSKIIKFLRDKYLDSDATVWEQPEDLGELSLEKLFKKYSKVIENKSDVEVPKKVDTEEERRVGLSNDYTYEIIYNFGDVEKYAKPNAPTSWCISTGEGNLRHYMRANNSFFVIFTKNGWKDVPRVKGKSYPLDEFGLSAMAMQLSKEDGHIVGGTTRWNHGEGFDISMADNRISQGLLCNLTGITESGLKSIRDTYKKFLPMHGEKEQGDDVKITAKDLAEAKRQFSYIKLCIKNSQSPFLPLPRNENGMFYMYNVLKADRPEYMVVNDEFKKKNWRKCIIAVTILVNDITFTTIMDHGLILSNEMISTSNDTPFLESVSIERIVRDGAYEEVHFVDSSTETFIILTLKNKKSVYDTKNKKFLQLNGEKLFVNVIDTPYRCILFMVGNNSYAIYDKNTGEFFEYNGRNEFENIMSVSTRYSRDISFTRGCLKYFGTIKFVNVIVEYATQEVFTLNLETMSVKNFNEKGKVRWLATKEFKTKGGESMLLVRKFDNDNPIPVGSVNNDYYFTTGYGDASSPYIKYDYYRRTEIPHFKMVSANTMKPVKNFSGMDIRYANDNYALSDFIFIIDYDVRDNIYKSNTNARYARLFDVRKNKFLIGPNGEEYFIVKNRFTYRSENLFHLICPGGNGYLYDNNERKFLYNDVLNNRIKSVDYISWGCDWMIIRFNTRCNYSGKSILFNPKNKEPFKYLGSVCVFRSIVDCPWDERRAGKLCYLYDTTGKTFLLYKDGDKTCLKITNLHESARKCACLIERLEKI